ncbi:MAG TPA: hypothetical protein VFA79_22405, partial [Myxococcales bacterium]|nr:hypothetical protein [Myxococcales bacterium]
MLDALVIACRQPEVSLHPADVPIADEIADESGQIWIHLIRYRYSRAFRRKRRHGVRIRKEDVGRNRGCRSVPDASSAQELRECLRMDSCARG